jgi:replication-associated recombination protein RarA
MIVTIDETFIKNVESYYYNFFIDEINRLYIYNKEFFLEFIELHSIKYINTINDNYYYLISDNEVFKYISSKKYLETVF